MPKVRTLFGHLPANSWGLQTSLPGRVLFLCFATAASLSLLRTYPYNFFPHLIILLTYLLAILVFGASSLLFRRSTLMLLLASFVIGIVNFLLPPAGIRDALEFKIHYGATRGLAYVSLAFATILTAVITRPSDFSRLFARLHKKTKPHHLLISAIPFSIFAFLATTFKDILTTSNSRAYLMRNPQRIYLQIVNVASGLLAVVLTRSHLLYQATFAWKGLHEERRYTPLVGNGFFFRWYDIIFIVLSIPGVICLWM